MPPYPLTNEEILHRLRYSEEWHHRRFQEYFYADRPITFTSSLPIPEIQLDQLEHIQDSCNKSTAIYSITPCLAPHTTEYCMDSTYRKDLIFSIYEKWFRDHNSDIDFGNFVAKLISLKIPSNEQRPTVKDMIKIHRAWCEHVENALPLCSKNRDPTGTQFVFYGPMGINQEQHTHYKIRPLFRALIIVTENQAIEQGAEQLVHLIHTNTTSELSAPITFESIRPRFEQDSLFGHGSDNVISTTLSAAIDFVMALESREQTAFPERCSDPRITDKTRLGDPMEKARSEGYTGPEIRGSSSTWVQLAEGEDVLPPITPRVLLRKLQAGLPIRHAYHRRRIEKDGI